MQSEPVRFQQWAILLIAATIGVSLCGAQDPSRPPVNVRGLLELIKVRGVYEDLDIVDFQKDRIQKVLNEMQVANRELADAISAATPEARADLIKKYKETSAKSEAELAAVLLPTQLERLKQIRMNIVARNDGTTFGLKNREFLEFLDLSDAQKADIEAKANEVDKVVKEKVKKLQAEIDKVKLEARDDIIKLLTPEQRKKYLELVGRPFEGDRRK